MDKSDFIRNYGDSLERHYADKILCSVPGYALFWATYIGNDGRANYLPMPDVAEGVLTARVRLWEHLYTLFESLALCWRLEERFTELASIDGPAAYADNLNDWIAFHAHLGRIHDMAEKVAREFHGDNLFAPFDPFYEQRHTVLHYPKVPMRFAENVLAAPRLGVAPKNWKQGMRWEDLKGDDFHFLADLVTSDLRELATVINKFFYRMTELVKLQKGFAPVKWPDNRSVYEARPLSFSGSAIRFEPEIQPPYSGIQTLHPPSDSNIHP